MIHEFIENKFADRKNVTGILEVGYLSVLTIYLLRVLFDTTLFSISWPKYFDTLLRLCIFMIVLLRAGYDNAYMTKEWLLCTILVAVYYLSWFFTGYIFLMDTAMLIAGAMNIDYKKILKVYFWCGIFVVSISVLASLTGVIDNLVYFRENNVRYSFGIVYPTDFAAHIVYLALVFWAVYENVPSIVVAGVMVLMAVFVKKYCDANCSAIILFSTSLSMIFVYITDKKCSKIAKWIDRLFMCILPIGSFVIIMLSYLYDNSDDKLLALNTLLTYRLSYAHDAFVKYGVKLFGTPFDLIGYGGNTVAHGGYNFVDSSYCLILVRYGIAALAAVYIWYGQTMRKIWTNKQRKLLYAIGLVALHSIIEHHYIELAYNAFLLLTFSSIRNERGVEATQQRRPSESKEIYRYVGVTIICIIAAFIVFPYILDYIRTVVSLFDLNSEYKNIYFILGISLLVLILCVGVIIIKCGKKYSGILAVYFICVMALLALVNANVNKKSAVYTESVSTGTHIIEALNDSMVDKYSVFVDDVPLLYKKNVQGITSHYIMGNGLSKKKGVVLIANSQTDLYRLIENGFYYGEISDYEGIYTNSEEAVEIIKNCGVAMNNYYSTIKHVDFVKDAKISSLALEENGKIILKGSDNKPLYGPYEILYNGNFKVNYCFKYMEGSLENEPVARVRFTANYGQTIYAEQEIYKSDFDENGFCNVTLERYIPSSETVEFIVYVNGDTVLEVQDICYWKEND